MRYVIGVCIATGMLVADGVYHDGHYLDYVLRSANWLVQSAIAITQ